MRRHLVIRIVLQNYSRRDQTRLKPHSSKRIQSRLQCGQAFRISDLLDVPVGVNDCVSECIYEKYKRSWIVVIPKCVRDRLIQIHPFTYANISMLPYCYALYYVGQVLGDITVYQP